MSYAGFWKRVAAMLIDAIIITPIMIGIGMVLGVALVVVGSDSIQFVLNIIGLIVSCVYFALMESSGMQGTLGKKALGIKVTDLKGNQISFNKATDRYLCKLFSLVILAVGYIMVAFTERKQGLHDIMAECVVVNK